MPRRDGIRVTVTTSGSPSSGYRPTGGGYKYRGDPTWTPNDARYQEEPFTGGAARKVDRAARLAEFAGYLEQGLTAQQAGRLLGIAPKTARTYERELRNQQRGEGHDG